MRSKSGAVSQIRSHAGFIQWEEPVADCRARLEAMPEIERENILAARQEEMQKFKDSAQLDAMFKMAGMDEDSNRKKRT